MAHEVILPRVDMDMAEGKIALWHVANGDTVRKGQLLFEMETSKATMEVEAEAAGVIQGIRAEDLEVDMPVGTTVAWILRDGELLPDDIAPAPTREPEAAAAIEPEPVLEGMPVGDIARHTPAPLAATSRPLLRATPLARSIARERGISLEGVAGSGERGRIHAADLHPAPLPQGEREEGRALHLQWFTRGNEAPLVLLHGFGSELGSWRPLLAQLKGIPALGIDLPAHGKSPALSVAGFDALAQALLTRLDAEGVGPVHLVGHSLGGGAALALADLLGHRLRSLTLLAPAGFGPEIHGGFVQGLLRAQGEASLRPWLALLFGNAARLDGSFVATAAQQLRSADKRAGLAALAERFFPDGTQAESLRARLDGIAELPTKIVWGALDRIAPPHQADGLPGLVALHRLPGIGHLPQVEAAALLATLLRQQLAAAGAARP